MKRALAAIVLLVCLLSRATAYHNMNFYEVLGLPMHASDEEIKRAFELKTLEYHPSRNEHNLEWSTPKFNFLLKSYDLVTDRERRKAFKIGTYNLRRRNRRPERIPPDGRRPAEEQ
jgi:DnaJ-class molecular chaperone